MIGVVGSDFWFGKIRSPYDELIEEKHRTKINESEIIFVFCKIIYSAKLWRCCSMAISIRSKFGEVMEFFVSIFFSSRSCCFVLSNVELISPKTQIRGREN